MCIANPEFRFLDISNYLAPGYSYAKFLKAYFPYEWLDDERKLEATSLPPPEAFYSPLKQKNTLGEGEGLIQNYEMLQQVWERQGIETFQDLLEYYNNLDVKPFVEAVEKMQAFYKDIGVDFLKECLSTPGVARKFLFQDRPTFSLFGLEDVDLNKTIKKNIVGGPSIIFTRYHEAGKNQIRKSKLSQNIVGYDCDVLYLWAIGEDMQGVIL